MCNGPNCLTCPTIKNAEGKITSTVTGRTYDIINHTNESITCKSNNIIYLMTCKLCGIQYVGETNQLFSKRNTQHRSSSKHGKPSLIYQHFHLYDNGTRTRILFDDFDIQPIEALEQNSTASERLNREAWWMKELRTLYPYGLNDKCGNTYFSKYSKDRLVYSVFNYLKIKRFKRGKGKKRKLTSNENKKKAFNHF